MPKREPIIHHRIMTADEFVAALEALGLRQGGAAQLFNIPPRMVRRYASGDWTPKPMMAALLRLMIERKVTPDELHQMTGAPWRGAATARR